MLSNARRLRSRPLVGLAVVLLGVVTVAGFLAAPAYAAAPTISSFSPTSGAAGTTVTITGTGFAAPATAKFNGVAATTSVVSSTKISARVPNLASTGKISVTTSAGTATSTGTFTVLPGVIASSAGGRAGSTVTLALSGYEPFEAVDVYFDSTDVLLVSTSGTGTASASLTIPTNAEPGPHWITAIGRHSGGAAQYPFAVRTDWRMTGFSGAGNGYNPFEHILNFDNVDQLSRAWQTAQIAPSGATPAIAGGRAYIGGGDGYVRSFDLATGAQKWARNLGSPVSSGAAAGAGLVFVGTDAGQFFALDLNTGAIKWQDNLVTPAPFHAAPVVVGNVVYVGANNGLVFAFDATTGNELWDYDTGTIADHAVAVSAGTVYITAHAPFIVALDADSGLPKWAFTESGAADFATPPIVLGGMVFFGSVSGKIYAFHANGAEAWTYQAPGGIHSTPAAGKGVVYFGDDTGTVTALRAVQQQPEAVALWSQSLGDGALRQALTLANGLVYAAGNLTSRTDAVDVVSGDIAGVVPASTVGGGPAVVDGTLTVVDANYGRLVHYVLPTPGAAVRPHPKSLRPDRSLVATHSSREAQR